VEWTWDGRPSRPAPGPGLLFCQHRLEQSARLNIRKGRPAVPVRRSPRWLAAGQMEPRWECQCTTVYVQSAKDVFSVLAASRPALQDSSAVSSNKFCRNKPNPPPAAYRYTEPRTRVGSTSDCTLNQASRTTGRSSYRIYIRANVQPSNPSLCPSI